MRAPAPSWRAKNSYKVFKKLGVLQPILAGAFELCDHGTGDGESELGVSAQSSVERFQTLVLDLRRPGQRKALRRLQVIARVIFTYVGVDQSKADAVANLYKVAETRRAISILT